MSIDFQSARIRFEPHSGSAQDVNRDFTFPVQVRKAESFINGYNIGFTGTDHHIFRQEINTAIRAINGNVVTVRAVFSLRDSSGTFDDAYDGFIDVVVVADLEEKMD
jgi:hypothetical protein